MQVTFPADVSIVKFVPETVTGAPGAGAVPAASRCSTGLAFALALAAHPAEQSDAAASASKILCLPFPHLSPPSREQLRTRAA